MRGHSNETISISEFKARCLALLERVKRTGRPLLITRRGEPVALVVSPPPIERQETWLGCMAGTGVITGDIVSPASDENDWEALGDNR